MPLIPPCSPAKQAHWSVVGPRFRSIHLALDEVVTDARAFTDEVAERATAVGVSPDGRSTTVVKDSALDEVSAESRPTTRSCGS